MRMLINCPKCGFSQPKDRYCANCGVDMDAFRPKAPPMMKTLLGNPAFHIGIVVVLAIGAWVMIRQNQKRELAQRMQFLSQGPVVVERSQKPEPPVAVTAAEAENSPERAGFPPPPPPPTDLGQESQALRGQLEAAARQPRQREARVEAKLTATLDSQTTNSETAARDQVKLIAYYTELDQAALGSLIRESQRSGQYNSMGDAFWGVVPNFDQQMVAMKNVRTVARENKTFDSGQPVQQWFIGHHSPTGDPEQDQGLTIYLSLNEGEGVLRGEIEVQRSFREGARGTPNNKMSYPAAFELRPGQGFMIGGILPRRPNFEPSDNIDMTQGFMSIFRSAQFQSGQTQFTLLLEFDTQ